MTQPHDLWGTSATWCTPGACDSAGCSGATACSGCCCCWWRRQCRQCRCWSGTNLLLLLEGQLLPGCLGHRGPQLRLHSFIPLLQCALATRPYRVAGPHHLLGGGVLPGASPVHLSLLGGKVASLGFRQRVAQHGGCQANALCCTLLGLPSCLCRLLLLLGELVPGVQCKLLLLLLQALLLALASVPEALLDEGEGLVCQRGSDKEPAEGDEGGV
mmetsp:Transcript_33311/g.73674  ORF Transcript_33311/g.73674 Transcript_33311/m.73674 type:complete len:215 (-) Transcript_33311:326-970(-)